MDDILSLCFSDAQDVMLNFQRTCKVRTEMAYYRLMGKQYA